MLDSNTDIHLRNQILKYHLADLLTDVERAKLLGLPAGCRIRERAKILSLERLRIGKNVWIGEGAVLDAQGGLEIGDNTQIGLNVMVWSHTSHKQAIDGNTGSGTKNGIKYSETRIGANCFIGGPSVIAPGVIIGDGVIISPLTFVDRNVADGEVFSAPRNQNKLQQKVERLEALVRDLKGRLDELSERIRVQ